MANARLTDSLNPLVRILAVRALAEAEPFLDDMTLLAIVLQRGGCPDEVLVGALLLNGSPADEIVEGLTNLTSPGNGWALDRVEGALLRATASG